jgi:hypothetical protein
MLLSTSTTIASSLPALIESAGERAAWRFLEFLHRQYPQQKYPHGLHTGRWLLSTLVREQRHHAHSGRAAGACGRLRGGIRR